MKISEELGYKRGVSIASGNLGSVYYDLGEYTRAIEFYESDLKISQELGDKRGMGLASCNLGDVYIEIKQFIKAREYLMEAKRIFESIGAKSHLIYAFIVLAELSLRDDYISLCSAEEYAKRALSLSEEIGIKFYKADTLLVMGKIYSKKTQIGEITSDNAELCFTQAIKIFKDLNRRKELADTWLEYGRFLKEIRDPGYRDYLKLAYDAFKRLKLKHKVEEVKRCLG